MIITVCEKTALDLCITNKQLSAMKVEQIYTGCLAHGAYYITSNGHYRLCLSEYHAVIFDN